MIRSRDLKIENAWQCARDQHDRFGVRSPDHIDVEGYAAYLGVTVMTVKLDGAEAQLIRTGKLATILLSDRIASPQVRRFAIAHELGHLLLDHPSQIPSRIRGLERSYAPLVEVTANAFASELLMPAALVREMCDLSKGDLDTPREIAQLFDVSLLAASIRYTELSRQPCAAVFSVAGEEGAGKIRWVTSSASMEARIRRGRRLSSSSVASSFFASGRSTTDPTEVPWDAWFDRTPDGRVIEHVTCAPKLRTTLSMVSIHAQ